MLIQVVGRLIAHLPVTLLEVNTLGHVLCAFMMFAFWFHKPLDVRDPILLSEDWARPLLALWSMKSKEKESMKDLTSSVYHLEGYRELDRLILFARPDRRDEVECRPTKQKKDGKKEKISQAVDENSSILELLPRSIEQQAPVHGLTSLVRPQAARNPINQAQFTIHKDLPDDFNGFGRQENVLFYLHEKPLNDDQVLQLVQGSKLWQTLTRVYHTHERDKFEIWWGRWWDRLPPEFRQKWTMYRGPQVRQRSHKAYQSVFVPQHLFLDESQRLRWQAAFQGLNLDPGLHLYVTDEPGKGDNKAQKNDLKTGYATHRVENWPSREVGLISSSTAPAFIMAAVTAVYGALHAFCWHSHFPSRAEKILWRISAVAIAAGPLSVVGVISVGAVGGLVVIVLLEGIKIMDALEDVLGWTALGVASMLSVVCGVVYVGARLFILVEAFVCLRSLPAEAYQTPNWTSWLPHL